MIERLHPTADRPAFELASGSVLVAHDVSPADAVRLGRSKAVAIVTEVGSPSGHTALVARTFGMIALVGVRNATHVVSPGDVVVVNALDGQLIVRADESEVRTARQRGEGFRAFSANLLQRSGDSGDRPVTTSDGESVYVQANLELAEEATLAMEAGADGIGLYRTEFFYLGVSGPPSEEAQLQAYAQVVRTFRPRPVTIRTYDLGADKLPAKLKERSWVKDANVKGSAGNPALGLRALRFSLAELDLFRAQLRAICRAAALGPVRLMFPMVTTAGELRKAIGILRSVEAELDHDGLERGAVGVGAMIEVPAAAISVRRFVPQVSFLSVGTNDLVQYTLAVDRSDAAVAHLADPLDPAHLRLLAEVAQACSEGGIDAAMCGNMAADLVALPVVLGLGYRTLSVPCAVVPLAKAAVQRIDAAAASDAAQQALDLESAGDVRSLVRYRFGPTIGELWRRSGILDSRDRRPSSKPPPT